MESGIFRGVGYAFSSLILAIGFIACGGGVPPTVPSTSPSGPVINDLPGEGVQVQPARATWDTGYFQEAL